MDKIKVEKYAYIFGDIELNKLIACLVYCRHRLSTHGVGIEKSGVDIKFIDYMVMNLRSVE